MFGSSKFILMIHVIAYEFVLVISDNLFSFSAIIYSNNLLVIIGSVQ